MIGSSGEWHACQGAESVERFIDHLSGTSSTVSVDSLPVQLDLLVRQAADDGESLDKRCFLGGPLEFFSGDSRPLVQAARLMVAGLHPNLRPHSRTRSDARCLCWEIAAGKSC
jgi:hypothetical protein